MTFLQSVANVLSGTIERARAEEQLRLSRGQLAGILDNADDAIISIDQGQKITMFNHGAEKIFGYTAQEVAGQPLGMLIPQRLRQAHDGHVRGFGEAPVVARRMGERSEIFGRRKDGTEFPAEASISKIPAPEGVIFTAILRDITERKHAEAVLEGRVVERTTKLQNEIAQREATQQALVRSQKLQGLGELAGGMAHDFNNLLTVTLHELATNAAKHGALSEPHGEVSVQWKCESVGTPDGRLVIEWRESGGPEVKPSRCGYGSGLIRELIPYEVPGSSVDLDPAPSGVTCRIVLPLAQIFPNGS